MFIRVGRTIITTAPEGDVVNEDHTGSVHPYSIRLQGEEAEEFMGTLTVWGPLGEDR